MSDARSSNGSVRVLVAVASRHGATAQLAGAVAEGIRQRLGTAGR